MAIDNCSHKSGVRGDGSPASEERKFAGVRGARSAARRLAEGKPKPDAALKAAGWSVVKEGNSLYLDVPQGAVILIR